MNEEEKEEQQNQEPLEIEMTEEQWFDRWNEQNREDEYLDASGSSEGEHHYYSEEEGEHFGIYEDEGADDDYAAFNGSNYL